MEGEAQSLQCGLAPWAAAHLVAAEEAVVDHRLLLLGQPILTVRSLLLAGSLGNWSRLLVDRAPYISLSARKGASCDVRAAAGKREVGS